MLANPTGKLHQLTTQLLIQKRYEIALERGLKDYQIRQYNISHLTPDKILEMYTSLTTKFYFNRVPGNNQSWYQNELRIYIWLLVGYSYLKNRCISKMNEGDWKIFSQIFNDRNPEMFEFQALTILKRESKFSKWGLAEVSLLDSIIKAKSIKNKWNEIAKELFIRSGKKYFRTAKQCREYWINHLDPVPVRRNWTALEDFNLIEAVKELGKKWSKVSKKLGGKRTEHMVKNRFKSLYHFESKRRNISIDASMKEEDVLEQLSMKLKFNMEEEQKLQDLDDKIGWENNEHLKSEKKQSAEVRHLQKFETVGSLKEVEDDGSQKIQIQPQQGQYPVKQEQDHEESGDHELRPYYNQNLYPRHFNLEDCFNTFFNDPDHLPHLDQDDFM